MHAPATARRVGSIEIAFFFTAFIAATYAFGIYFFPALIPEMRRDLGFDQEFVGLATGLSQAGLMIAAFLSSILVPIIGPMRVMLITVAVNAAGLLAMAAISNPVFMVPVMAAFGGCAGAAWIAVVAISPDVLPARHQGKLLGLMSSGTAYGVFLNGLILPPLVSGWGWRTAWTVVGVLSTALLVAAAWRLAPLWGHSTRRAQPPGAAQHQPRNLRGLLQPTAILVIAILFVSGLVLSPFQTYLSSLLREGFGWRMETASRCWSAIGIGGMFGGFLLGAAADRISAKWAMVVAYGLLILAALSVFLAQDIWPVYLGTLLFGAAFNAIFGLIAAYIAKHFPPGIAVPLQGATMVALGCGSMLGNYLGGLIADRSGRFEGIYIAVLCGVIVLLVCALAAPREDRVRATVEATAG